MKKLEIMYRALKGKTWVYGNLFYKDKVPIIQNNGTFITCKKGTEGLYSKVKDFNRKLIFEGDKVMCDGFKGVVEFSNGAFKAKGNVDVILINFFNVQKLKIKVVK